MSRKYLIEFKPKKGHDLEILRMTVEAEDVEKAREMAMPEYEELKEQGKRYLKPEARLFKDKHQEYFANPAAGVNESARSLFDDMPDESLEPVFDGRFEGVPWEDGSDTAIATMEEHEAFLAAEEKAAEKPKPKAPLFPIPEMTAPPETVKKEEPLEIDLFQAQVDELNAKIDALAPGENLRIENIPGEVYHATRGLGSTALKHFESCPAKYKAYVDGLLNKPSKCLDIGSAAHAAILEPHLIGVDFQIIPADITNKNSKVFKELKAERPDVTWFWPKEMTTILGVRDSVLGYYGQLFTGGAPEVSYWKRDEETGLILKSRVDYENGDLAVDLKTTANAKPAIFNKRAADFGYFLQNALYLDVTGLRDFLFVVVEPEAPYLCNLCQYAEQDQIDAHNKYRDLLRGLKECHDSGRWPGYSNEPFEIHQLTIPSWKR